MLRARRDHRDGDDLARLVTTAADSAAPLAEMPDGLDDEAERERDPERERDSQNGWSSNVFPPK